MEFEELVAEYGLKEIAPALVNVEELRGIWKLL